jgi:hypothetical protein
MHQLKAAGKTVAASVDADGRTRVAAVVVDTEACRLLPGSQDDGLGRDLTRAA